MDAQVQLNQDISETIEKFNESLAKSDIYSEKEKEELKKEIEDLKK
jgi:tellurite resistance protein